MLLVDTNVLVDALENDPEWADWSIGQLRAQSKIHRLAINPIIYTELSLAFSTVEALDKSIEELGLVLVELPRPEPMFRRVWRCWTWRLTSNWRARALRLQQLAKVRDPAQPMSEDLPATPALKLQLATTLADRFGAAQPGD